jgi:transcriptional regulator with XRE-family HTH domain
VQDAIGGACADDSIETAKPSVPTAVMGARARMRVKIKQVREEKNIKQAELADLINLSRPYLAQIESGQRNLTAARQEEIAKALGVSPIELIDFDAPSEDDEKLLVNAFRSMNEEQRANWIELAQVYLGSPKRE